VNIGIGGDEVISASIVETYRSTFLGSSTAPIINYCASSNSCSTTNLPSTGNTGMPTKHISTRSFQGAGSWGDDLLLLQ